MSFIIQKQFYELDQVSDQQKPSNEGFQNLKQLLNDWCFQMEDNNIIKALTLQLESISFRNLHYMIVLELMQNPDILSITYFLLINNIPLKVESPSHRIKLYSYLMRINANILFSKFSICPKSGLLKYNYQSFLTQSQLRQFKCSSSILLRNNLQLLRKIEQNCVCLEHYVSNIFEIMNVKQNYMGGLVGNKKSLSDDYYEKQLATLSNMLPFIHHDIQFLIKSKFQIKQIEPTHLSDSIKSILQLFLPKSRLLLQEIPNPTAQKTKQFVWLSVSNNKNTINLQKTHQKQVYFIKQTLRKVKNVSQNVNCIVDLYTGKKVNSNQLNPKTFSHFVKKSSVSSRGQKLIERQIQYLHLLMQHGGKYDIGEYYNVSTIQFDDLRMKSSAALKGNSWSQNSICMAYYPLNIGQYVNKRRIFMSQTSKLMLLLKVQKALASLHREGSQHLDIKPENIMMDVQQNIRLIDFGQSILQKLPLSSKPGVSIPYSPPQFFSKYKFNPYRCDIYSFGVLIHEILFGQLPQILPSRKQKAVKFYQSQSQYRKIFQIQPQNFQMNSQKRLAQLVVNFCMKCMHENPQLRPSQSWIRIYLKKLLQYSYNY